MVQDQRDRSAYILGPVYPARDSGAALVLTHVSVAAMNQLLAEVASQLPPDRHAAMLIDNAGWHKANDLRAPLDITLVHLPPYSPEPNAIEKIWLALRNRSLSDRLVSSTWAILAPAATPGMAETGRDRPNPLPHRPRMGRRGKTIVLLVLLLILQ